MRAIPLYVYQDDDFSHPVRFRDGDGVPLDISAWTLAAHIRTEPGASGDPVETFTVTVVSEPDAEIALELTDAETAGLDEGTYAWDLERVADGKTKTLLAGPLYVRADVTRTT
jgi:hypothetical protein